jgi:multicomponent Na+:H+ antiporter subunit D
MEAMMLTLIFLPFLWGVLIFLIDKVSFTRTVFMEQVLLSVLVGWLLWQGETSVVLGGWPGGIGIEMAANGFGRLFLIMTAVAFWYVYAYLWKRHHEDHKLFLFLGMLQGALYGLYMTRDLFTMFLLIEFVTILASVLILYERDAVSVRAGLYYLIFNAVGMLIFLLGTIALYVQFGTLNLTMIGTLLPGMASSNAVQFALACFMTSFAVKTAAFPVGGWLPVAHGYAPTFISALLSGLVVKSGLFLYLFVIMPFDSEWIPVITLALGVTAALYGVIRAIFQTDIKRMLAFHTVSQVGLMVIGLSMYQLDGGLGGMMHAFNHFMFKSLLFLTAGSLARMYETRNLGKIKGVMRSNPFLGVSIWIGVLAISGAPWMIGSVGKTLIKSGAADGWLIVALTLINAGTAISFSKWIAMLFGPKRRDMKLYTGKKFAIGMLMLLVVVLYPVEAWILGLDPFYKLTSEISNYLGLVLMGAAVYLGVLRHKPDWAIRLGRFVPDVRQAFVGLILLFGGLQWLLVLG